MRGASVRKRDTERSTLWPSAVANVGRLFGIEHDGDWFHVGTPQALSEAERLLR